MGLTLLQRETFQGVGTLNAAAPGNLGTVATGSFFKRPVGPRLAGDTSAQSRGWSADLQGQGNAYFEPCAAGSGVLPASGSNDRGMYAVDLWRYLDAPLTTNGTGKRITYLGLPSGAGLLTASISGQTLNAATYGTLAGAGFTFPLRTWVQYRIAFAQIDGYWNYQASVLVRLAGASAFTEVFTATYQPTQALSTLDLGFDDRFTGDSSPVRGRLGMFSAYQLDAWSDRTLLDASVIDPPAGPFDWYCNPATGNDNNDGCTPGTAWASVAKINAESANLGMFGRAGANGSNGDALHLDLSGGSLFLGLRSLVDSTDGLNLIFSGNGEVQAWDALPAGAWAPVNGTAHVYSQVPPIPTSRSIVWENDRWPLFALGSSLGAVQAYLEATPGSCWCDAASGTVYLHPLGDTDPRTDGKAYTYSISRQSLDAEQGAPGIIVAARDWHLDGGGMGTRRVWKTALFDYVANTPYLSYALHPQGNSGGTATLANFFAAYGGAHGIGFVDADIARHYTISHCRAEQCCPGSFGQTSCWVDFSGTVGAGTATVIYDSCVTLANSGAAGSAAGQVDGQAVWLSHSGGGLAFAQVSFLNCNLHGGAMQSYGDVAALTFTGGSVPGGNFAGAAVTVAGTDAQGGSFTAPDGGTVTVINPPAITSAATATAYAGQPFSFQPTATGNPTSWSATGLPAGLSINTTTGLISGTPT